MTVTIRKFVFEDIPNKIKWVNDPQNNKYLHYDLPLEYVKTVNWFENNKNRPDRYDAVIEVDGTPVGLIGLLSIDMKNKKAEYYISMGNASYKGKGVAYNASKLILKYGFEVLGLNRLYLYTEVDNTTAQKLFEKVGFKFEGLRKNDISSNGKFVDRYAFAITKDDYLGNLHTTPIHFVDEINANKLYIKRDDMIPFSFGGNKVRKGNLFFEEIDKGGFDCIVTYGSSHSNHCRIISNMAAMRNMSCYIIGPQEVSKPTFNSGTMELFGAEIIIVPVEEVHDTIENKLSELRDMGKKPYFIAGGGHGNIGTKAYIDCYEEIKKYEQEKNTHFNYIFFASGTGTTQAGLVCGQIINGDERNIIGISIARKNPRGRQVVLDSIHEYLDDNNIKYDEDIVDKITIFEDKYIGRGYGKNHADINETIREMLVYHGIPMDSTYTAKAYTGMKKYIDEHGIKGKNILFIHTGGTPLFFDDLSTGLDFRK